MDGFATNSNNEIVPGSTLEAKKEDTGEDLGQLIFNFHVKYAVLLL